MAQLGEILLQEGMITREQLIAALETQRTSGKMLGRVLVDQGVLTESQLVSALATQIGLPFVDLSDTVLDGSAVSRLPGAVCRRHHVLPLGVENGYLVLAMSDPANVVARDDADLSSWHRSHRLGLLEAARAETTEFGLRLRSRGLVAGRWRLGVAWPRRLHGRALRAVLHAQHDEPHRRRDERSAAEHHRDAGPGPAAGVRGEC